MNRSVLFPLALLALLALGGCVNLDPQPDPTRFYTLSPRQLAPLASDRVAVEVSRVPYYAQTKRIAFRRGEFEVAYFPFDRWSGPLEVMLASRVRERLEPWAVASGVGHWRVDIQIIACEGSADGQAHFGADYTLWRGDDVDPILTNRFLDSVSWDPDGGAATLVPRIGALADALADRIAADLAEGNFAPDTPPEG